jgi:hypothetical protein
MDATVGTQRTPEHSIPALDEQQRTAYALSAPASVMAWANDLQSGVARYVLEVAPGARCKCAGCGSLVLPVNSRNPIWKRRPHFRHESGSAEEHRCRTAAARSAIERTLANSGTFRLPGHEVRVEFVGVSGARHLGRAFAPAKDAHLERVLYSDEALFILRLDDGRLIRVVGKGTAVKAAASTAAAVELTLDDEQLSAMSPEQIRDRLYLDPHAFVWRNHCDEKSLEREALLAARALAHEAIDVDTSPEVPQDWKRESALHQQAKLILAHAAHVVVPAVPTVQIGPGPWGIKSVALTEVVLEHRLGRVIPDIVCRADSHEMLIEITVHHPIGHIKQERLVELGLPVLEIDLRRRTGLVTREELSKILVDEVDCKRWAYHPRLRPLSLGPLPTKIFVANPKPAEAPRELFAPVQTVDLPAEHSNAKSRWWPRPWIWNADPPNSEARANIQAAIQQHKAFGRGQLNAYLVLSQARKARSRGVAAEAFIQAQPGEHDAIAHLLWAADIIYTGR